jgi:hypothetical protein
MFICIFSYLLISSIVLLSPFTMADEKAPSHRPEALQRQESVHPSLLRPEVPVTPGIHLGSYAGDGHSDRGISYFSHDTDTQRNELGQSRGEAGADSGQDILQRMSLSGGDNGEPSLADTDPRSAFPSLSLSGNVISATFCIPHSLEYRKGRDWVRKSLL